MYSNILVPIALDSDDARADQAIKTAQGLASEGARITLLHVVEAMPNYAISYIPDNLIAETRIGIKKEMAALAEAVPGGVSDVIVGHSGQSILDYAKEHGCDVIVVASHRPGMQSLLLGSTATHVVRHATCAVHVLR